MAPGDDITAYWFYGDSVVVHLTGEEADGRFCLLEFLRPP